MSDTDPEAKKFSRPGCGKKLYASNVSGMCSSGCFSEDAPPALRARTPRQEKRAARPAPKAKSPAGGTLESFRAVCVGLGKDPDEEIEKFCAGWLDALRERLES